MNSKREILGQERDGLYGLVKPVPTFCVIFSAVSRPQATDVIFNTTCFDVMTGIVIFSSSLDLFS